MPVTLKDYSQAAAAAAQYVERGLMQYYDVIKTAVLTANGVYRSLHGLSLLLGNKLPLAVDDFVRSKQQ